MKQAKIKALNFCCYIKEAGCFELIDLLWNNDINPGTVGKQENGLEKCALLGVHGQVLFSES